jgi:FMN phosphatase YigB (HAD superfamily)
MPPVYVFDVNETLLDLRALDAQFERAFGDPGAREAWFQQLVPVGQLWLVAAHGWDVAGALAAGCRATFVARPGRLPDPLAPPPEVTGDDLEQVADQLLALHHRDAGGGGR